MLVGLASLAGHGCEGHDQPSGWTRWRFELPPGYPEPAIPEGNPLTTEKVELGRHLFYDERLSGPGTIACSSCHEQSRAFADGRRVPEGVYGEPLPHNSQGLTNVGYMVPLTWANPALASLERQILVPLFAERPAEMELGGHLDQVFARLNRDPVYRDLFARAYPDDREPIRLETIRDALACFLRVLVTSDSPYDRYVYAGERGALSAAAMRGRMLFFSERLSCSSCHSGFNFTVATRTADSEPPERVFFNTGLYHRDGGYPVGVEGLFEATLDPDDRGAFRPPSLRNVALTPPYFHDGSAASLDEVIASYARGGRRDPAGGDGRDSPYKDPRIGGFSLSPRERDDLLAFLESLSDRSFVTDPRFADPWGAESLTDR